MDSLLDDFWCKGVARSGTVALGRGNPQYQGLKCEIDKV